MNAAAVPSDLEIDAEYLRETLLNAKEVRSRYTVMRAAETLGLLDEIVDEVVSEMECILK